MPRSRRTRRVGSEFDLDLVVVDDLRHLGDEAAGGDDRVAAADRLDHFLMRLGPLLLRPQDQEIHDHENDRERGELNQEIRLPAAGASGPRLVK